jgi:uncharacterized protein with ATP-grasp and redox domains
MTELLEREFTADSVPCYIGTDRDLLVQRMTGVDPYKELKQRSNEMALRILPELQSSIDKMRSSVQRFRRAALIAAAANAIEFDVAGREFNLEDFKDIVDRVESDLVVDNIEPFRRLCSEVRSVTYLIDNAGEVALDIILISQIKRLGPRVTAVVKKGPILNDATLDDARDVGLDKVADRVMDMGAPTIGIMLDRASQEFKHVLFTSELVVAKGMGHYESITELEIPCPVVHILRTKCNPVAEHIGVPRNKNVVLLRRPGHMRR